MGRKSSAKAQAKPANSSATPPSERSRPSTPIVLAGAALIVAIGGALVYMRTPAPMASEPAGQIAAQAVAEPPAAAKLGPHPQATLPPLPFDPEPPARPMDVVRAAYKFAAEHPEILSYVPCYCGCERAGHRGSEDCFVTARDANGDVTQWEPHGMT